MKSLQDIKNEVAIEKHGFDFDTLLYETAYGGTEYKHDHISRLDIDVIMDEVAKRYALEVAKETQRRCANRGLFHRTYNDVDDTPMLLQRQVLHKNNIPEY